MIIRAVDSEGIGFAIGLKPGDDVVSINDAPVRDVIDYQYMIYEPFIHLCVERNGNVLIFDFNKPEDVDLGIDFEEIPYRRCGCKCLFCFIDQNPKGMRKAIYFKDEDYRLSFLQGCYVTLSTIRQADLNRIITQRLSPLYISVHSLNPDVRRHLFGIQRDDRLIENISLLVKNHIELNTQIVLCPGINDGAILDETVKGLELLYPGVRSIAIVPVGLTKHRQGLPKIKPVTKEYAVKLILAVHRTQREYLKRFRERFVYLSDEWYLKAGRRLPGVDYYGDFFQLENGVGLTRQFIEEVRRQKKVFLKPLYVPRRLNILTGLLAQPILEQYLVPILRQAGNLSVTVTGISNELYGDSVDVSGLLSGSDFIRAIQEDAGDYDVYLLPPNCMNFDGVTLDDETIESMKKKTGRRIIQYNGDLLVLRQLLEQ